MAGELVASGPGGAPEPRPAPAGRARSPAAGGPAQLDLSGSSAVARPEYYGNPAGLTADIDVVKAIYAAFAVRDIDGALEFVDPACEIHVEGTARAAGRRGPYVGHQGLRRYFDDVDAVWASLEIHATDYRVVPGAVVVMGHVEGQGEAGAFRRSAIWTWKVADGRAVHVRVADVGPALAEG